MNNMSDQTTTQPTQDDVTDSSTSLQAKALSGLEPVVGTTNVIQTLAKRSLSSSEEAAVRQILGKTKLSDAGTFGSQLQMDNADLSNRLSELRIGAAGDAGQILNELLQKLQKVKTSDIVEPNIFEAIESKIPFLGKLVDNTKRYLDRFQTVTEEIQKIVNKLSDGQDTVEKDNVSLGLLEDSTRKAITGFELLIIAGDRLLQKVNSEDLPRLQKKANDSGDEMDLEDLNKLKDQILRFELRLRNLAATRYLSITFLRQLEQEESNGENIIEQTRSVVTFTIPTWKNGIMLALSILHQKAMIGELKDMREATEKLLLENSTLLGSLSGQIADEMSKGIVSMNTIDTIQQQTIATIKSTFDNWTTLDKKAAADRAQYEKYEQQYKQALKEGLMPASPKQDVVSSIATSA